jgi:uncharacterized repeat protein (TIGR01451 family)
MGHLKVSRLVALVGLSAAVALTGGSAAHASFTIGQTSGSTDSCGADQSFVQRTTAGAPSYVASSAGVIVSWDYLAGTSQPNIKLKVYRLKTSPSVWTLLHESAKSGGNGAGQVHANTLNTFTESPGIPIGSGEYLGLTGLPGGVNNTGMGCVNTSSSSDAVRVCCAMGQADTTMGDNTFLGELPNIKADVSAVVEPDADGDLYGDETQDTCPNDPTIHSGACPADIALTKTASPEPVAVGGTLTYTITARNVSATNSASNVAVNDPLPAGVTFKSASPSQGLCSGTTTVACSLGVVPASGSATVIIAVTPNAAGPLSNTATASADGDSHSDNDAATATSTVTGGGGTQDVDPPVFASATMTRTFAVDKAGAPETLVGARKVKKGTTFRYTLSEDARVVFTIARRQPGRRHGKACQKPRKSNRHGKRCTRYVRRGAFAQDSAAGPNKRAWSGKLGKKPLKPGRYRATLTARDAAGNTSKPKRLRFRIVHG